MLFKSIHGFHSKSRSSGLAALILFLFAVLALSADYVAPHSPLSMVEGELLRSPFESWRFVLGTDDVGRDLLSRLIHGAKISMGIGFASVFLALIVGGGLGAMAGYMGGVIEQVILRMVDLMMAVPNILLAIVVVAVLGPGLQNTVIAVAFVSMPGMIRVLRSSLRSERQKAYVQAAVGYGASGPRVLWRHLMPNVLGPVVIQSTLGFSDAILNAAALGFLGLGAQAPQPEWGVMLADARPYLEVAWWQLFFPGVCILLVSWSFNVLGDGLRDYLDPRSRA